MKLSKEQLKEIEDELKALLNVNDQDEDDYQCSIFRSIHEGEFDSSIVTIIQRIGGGEGGGEECNIVFTYKGNFFGFDFWYASYDGCNFEGSELYQVKPVSKITTEWEPMK